jgi:hypothetical protein
MHRDDFGTRFPRPTKGTRHVINRAATALRMAATTLLRSRSSRPIIASVSFLAARQRVHPEVEIPR